MLGIMDYGSGNLYAFESIYKQLSTPFRFIRSVEDFDECSHIILPGVGDYDETLRLLNNKGFVEKLNQWITNESNFFLGVCVGMQILGSFSEEGSQRGFNWIPGEIKKIPDRHDGSHVRLPHMGWNSLKIVKETGLFSNVDLEVGAYFLHNYEFVAQDSKSVVCTTDYFKKITSVVNKGNIYGIQFHPEKSLKNGVTVLNNFANL